MSGAKLDTHDPGMGHLSRLAWLGIAAVALGSAMLIASLAVPGVLGAFLRGYGAMLLPAAAWVFGGLWLRRSLARRRAREAASGRAVSSPRGGSLRP